MGSVSDLKGRLEDITYYNPDPINQASQFLNCGAKWIHMVDIDGAFQGEVSIMKYL